MLYGKNGRNSPSNFFRRQKLDGIPVQFLEMKNWTQKLDDVFGLEIGRNIGWNYLDGDLRPKKLDVFFWTEMCAPTNWTDFVGRKCEPQKNGRIFLDGNVNPQKLDGTIGRKNWTDFMPR